MPNINEAAVLKFYLDTQEYSDRLAAIEAEAATTLATQKSEVATAIAQVNLTQSQTITALTLEVSNLKTNLTDSITNTQTDLINRADQLAQNITDITQQLTQDKAAFTQEIQDALAYVENAEYVAPALRTPRKINGTDFDGRSDITTNAWGATRTFKIGNKTISINGTSNVAYSLADIGAFPEVGGTIQGSVEVTGDLSVGGTISATLEGTAASADKLQVARKIQGVDFDGTQDINLPIFTTQTDGLVPKRVGATTTKYLREDGTWVSPPNTSYALLTQANAEAGTDTAANTISAKVLKDTILFHTPTVTTIGGNAGTASKLQTSRIISLTGGVTGSVSFDGSANVSINTTITGLGTANGIATLDSSGKVPFSQLPSYVVSVAGKTGVVTLSKADVGLDNVDNTPDAQKPLSTATLLALDNKVNREPGKGLSTNDYSIADKTNVSKIVTNGLGHKYLSDDGSYKAVSGGDGGGGVTGADVEGWIARNIAVNNAYAAGTKSPSATHLDSISIGRGATSYGSHSIQIGLNAKSKQSSITIGTNAETVANDAVAIGGAARASQEYAVSIGRDSQAQYCSVAIGRRAKNSNNTHMNCVLLGSNTVVTSANQVQLGDSTTTTYAYGAVQDRSDIRDKTDIRDINLGLDFINKLRPVEYRWDYREDYFADVAPKREDFDSDEEYSTAYEQARIAFFENPVKDGSKTRTRHHTGLIAQEVKQAMDDLGVDFGGFQHHQEKDGLDVMSLGYTELIAVLIKAVQDLSVKVKSLENGILPSSTD